MWADNSSRGRSSQVFELVCRVFARRNLSQEARRRPLGGLSSARNQQATASARAQTPQYRKKWTACTPTVFLGSHHFICSAPVPQKNYVPCTTSRPQSHLPHPASLWQPLRVVASSDLGRDKATSLDSSSIPLASIASSRRVRTRAGADSHLLPCAHRPVSSTPDLCLLHACSMPVPCLFHHSSQTARPQRSRHYRVGTLSRELPGTKLAASAIRENLDPSRQSPCSNCTVRPPSYKLGTGAKDGLPGNSISQIR